jgi:2-oxoglutarate ferredoxin oxidoreductase subunit alpha
MAGRKVNRIPVKQISVIDKNQLNQQKSKKNLSKHSAGPAGYLQSLEGKSLFVQGDEAAAYGALFAGCRFYAGYPITPASEIFEVMARDMPKTGGYCIQMEDEIASISAVIGASATGAKAMTATSGPGFSLMQENIGYAIMTEIPCVIVDVQRSGPSTGQATLPAHGDVMQARWGTHGDHEMIALCPNSVQECFELAAECFNLSETYRTPVTLLMDGAIGHMRERLDIPALEKMKIVYRKGVEPTPLVPKMTNIGEGGFVHYTGSTHKENGMRDTFTREVHDSLVTRLYRKIDANREDITMVKDSTFPHDKVAVISYGAVSRPALGAVMKARENGMKVGHMRLVSVWPFPRKQVTQLGENVEKLIVPEMNLGQVIREVERCVDVDVIPLPKLGGIVHSQAEIFGKLREVYGE